MSDRPALSIIINNYNYGRYVADAIDSALAQRDVSMQVVIVDDGSTDESPAIIASYADRATVIMKANGGQASAFHAGFDAAEGDVIIFLDADDLLWPGAGAWAVETLLDAGVSKAVWPMQIVGPRGEPRGGLQPSQPPTDGDVLPTLIERGPLSYINAPTSGNAWPRRLLEAVLPMPESSFERGADGYLLAVSPVYGWTVRADEPLGAYRVHGRNFIASKSEFNIRDILRERYNALCDAAATHLSRRAITFDRSRWRHEHWDRLDELAATIESFVPASQPFVLVDEDVLNAGDAVDGRPRRHLLEEDGRFWGSPADATPAVVQLEACRREGVHHVVFAWYCFWWLDHYAELAQWLEVESVEVRRNEAAIAFRLKPA